MAVASKKRVMVVGGGLAGLACTIKLAEEGVAVDLISMVPVKRSHSVCAQGGINACNDIARQQGYSEWMHFDETVLGGDFLADQPPVLEMCNWAPRIIRSEEHTSELQSQSNLVCRLLLEKKKTIKR